MTEQHPDTVGETRQLAEGTRVAYEALSDVDQLQPSTTPRRDQAKGVTRKGAGISPPAPIDLDVLDWLMHAERTVAALAAEVVGAATGDPNPQLRRPWHATPDGQIQPGKHDMLVYLDRPAIGYTVPEALDAIIAALPSAPAEINAEAAARMWELARGGARLLGTDTPGLVRWRCPKCKRRSVMVRPGTDSQQLVCVHRTCRQTFTLPEVADPKDLVA